MHTLTCRLPIDKKAILSLSLSNNANNTWENNWEGGKSIKQDKGGDRGKDEGDDDTGAQDDDEGELLFGKD